MKKLGFLFLIVDKINHPDLWKLFFDQDKNNKHNIFIHYKFNKYVKHFESKKLNNCAQTKWGDISIVYAQNLLLKAAVDDGCGRS